MSTTSETISAAIQLIDPKKQNLQKAFDDLQSHSDFLSLFSLSWSHLDSHFTSLQNFLTQKLHLLRTLESQSPNPSSSNSSQTQEPSSSNLQTQIGKESSLEQKAPTQIGNNPNLPTQIAKDPNSSTQIGKDSSSSLNQPTQNVVEAKNSDESDGVAPRRELVLLCEKMDAIGLRKYVNDTKNNWNTIRLELLGALRHARDPALMVLNAMEGLYAGSKDVEVNSVRRTCVPLLEVLCGVSPNVGLEVRERAKKLALDWKRKVCMEGENQYEALAFLHLVAAYGLVSEFNMDELADHLFVVARHRQATDLCRRLGMEDKVSDLIQKLVSNVKHLWAIKFISEFDMTDKFPPVPILQAYVKESKRLANKVCEERNYSKKAVNEAIAKETGALKSVIKIIEDLKLESEYPPSSLERRINQLEKEKTHRKWQAAALARKPFQLQQQSNKLIQQQYGNKRPRMSVPRGSTVVSDGTAGLLVDSATQYVSAAAVPYVVLSTAPPVAPFVGSSTGLYGVAGGQVGLPGNPGPSSTHLYSSEQLVPSGSYNRLTTYGGYGVPPQHHPSYYSQQ